MIGPVQVADGRRWPALACYPAGHPAEHGAYSMDVFLRPSGPVRWVMTGANKGAITGNQDQLEELESGE